MAKPFGLRFKFPPGEWVVATTKAEAIMAKALTKSMREVARDGVNKSSQVIAASGLGSQVSKSMRFKMFPKGKDVLNPEAYIFSRINYLDIFERGGTIAGKKFLWLPLPNVPRNPGRGYKFGGIVGRDHMTPRQYVAKVGPLVTIRRPGKLPMLGAVVRGRGKITKGRLKRGGSGRGARQIIPLFVAVSSVTIRKRFSLTPAVEKAAQKLPTLYNQNEDKKPI